MLTKQFNVWLTILLCIIIAEASQTNFQVKKFQICNTTQGLIKYIGNIATENGNQFLNFDMTTPIPWDDSLGLICSIQTRTIGNSFLELFEIREKNFCKATHKYLGEFWYDIERASGLPPGRCPIPTGRYHVRHLLLDFKKVALQTFPFGRLRFIIKAIDNKNTASHVLCLLLEVDNVEN